MAYPTVSKPYGFKPVNLIGGLPYAGSTRLMKIPTNYATGIFYGDVVKLASSGEINKDVGQTTATPVGIFVGCTFTSPITKQPVYSQNWVAATAASDAYAYVVDDPNVLFKAVLVSGNTEDGNGLTPAYLGRTMVGSNVEIVQNTGDSSSGDSRIAIYSAAGGTTTASLPVRIIDVVPDTANSSGNYVEFICKWNMPYQDAGGSLLGGHQYLNPTGV